MNTSLASGALARRWTGLPGNLRGIVWLSIGGFALSVADVCVKALGRKFDPLEITLFRYAVGMILLAPVFMRMGWADLRTERIGMHLLRMSVAFLAQLGVFLSIIYLPLADATAIMFSKPLFTTVVAVIVLSEIVDRRRWTATFLGFVGVLIMIRPGSEGLDPMALVAVGAAFAFAVANVLIRVLARTEPTNRILFYYHIGGILVFAVPAWLTWRTPVGVEWMMMAAIGALTTAGIFCYLRAFSVGEANAVGPAENLRLIYAALFGYFLFSEIPSMWTAAGALIIVGCTCYIARVEARK